MATVRVVDHDGVAIHVFDFSRAATREDMLARIADARGAVSREGRDSVRTLVDVRDAFMDADIVRELGALAIANREAVLASAVVGSRGEVEQMRQLVSGLSGRTFQTFETMLAAMEWLSSQ